MTHWKLFWLLLTYLWFQMYDEPIHFHLFEFDSGLWHRQRGWRRWWKNWWWRWGFWIRPTIGKSAFDFVLEGHCGCVDGVCVDGGRMEGGHVEGMFLLLLNTNSIECMKTRNWRAFIGRVFSYFLQFKYLNNRIKTTLFVFVNKKKILFEATFYSIRLFMYNRIKG